MTIHEEKRVLMYIIENAPFGEDFLCDFEKESSINDFLKMNLISDLGYNSISFIELIVVLEDEFDIEFKDEMILYNSLATTNEIIDNIELLKASKGY